MKTLLKFHLLAALFYGCTTTSQNENSTSVTRECNCGEVELIDDFVHGMAMVTAGDCVYFLDENGQLAIPDTFYSATNFWGNYASVQLAGKDVAQHSIIDTTGKVILNIYENYDRVSVDWEGKYLHFEKGPLGNASKGIMDLTGKIIIPLQEDFIQIHGNLAFLEHNLIKTKIYNLKTGEQIVEYDGLYLGGGEGYSVISTNDFSFYIDSTGKKAIGEYSQWAGTFSEGLAQVREYREVGFINTSGELVIPYQFADNLEALSHDFHEGLCIMSFRSEMEEPKLGFIDRSGKMVIQDIYDDAWDFENGYARVEQNDTMCLIDKKGNLIVRSNFDYFGVIGEGVYLSIEDGKIVVFDNKNNRSNIKFEKMTNSYNGKVIAIIDGELISISLDSIRNSFKPLP